MANAIVVTATPKGKKTNESKDSSPVQSSEVLAQGSTGEPEVSVSQAPVVVEQEVHPEFGVLLPNGRAYLIHSH